MAPDNSGDAPPYSKSIKGLIASADSYGGECCNGSDNTDCTALDGSNNVQGGFVMVNPDNVDIDLAVASCPTKQDFCGPSKEIEFSGPNDDEVTL